MIPNVMDIERTYMLSQQNLPFKQIARQGKSYYNSTIMNNRDPSSNQNNSHQICCACAIAQTKHILDWAPLVP